MNPSNNPFAPELRAALAALALAAAHAHAQTDQSLLLKPWDGPAILETATEFTWTPRTHPDNGPSGAVLEFASAGRVQLTDQYELRPAIGYDVYRLQISHAPANIPPVLSDESVAFATPIAKLDDDWFLAASAGVGYAGDDAFHRGTAWYAKAAFTAGTKLSDKNSLALWLDYNGNRTLFPDLPLPQFAFSHDDDTLEYVLGIPESSLTWNPTPRFTLDASYDFPLDLDVQAHLHLTGHTTPKDPAGLDLIARAVHESHAFHAQGLPDHQRLFFEEQRAELALRFQGPCRSYAQLGLAWVFSREFSTGFDERNLSTTQSYSDALALRFELGLVF